MSDESLFREVDEEVRQEQFKKLWARYGNALIGLAVLVIVVVAGVEGWRYWQVRQAETSGDSFFAAAGLAASGKTEEALSAFAAISGSGYAELAKFREAAVLVSSGKADEAVKIYDAIAADAAVDQTLRDLARVRAAFVLADTAAVADIEQRLSGLTAAESAWRHVARELLAAAKFRLKDYKGADQELQGILSDLAAPPALRQRAQVMAEVIKPLVAAP